MTMLLFEWLGVLTALFLLAIGRSREGGALTLAYFLSMSLIHVPGVLAYLGPVSIIGDYNKTEVGFEITLIGMASLVVGAILARQIMGRAAGSKLSTVRVEPEAYIRLGWRMLATGVVSYFVLLPVANVLPSVTALVSALGTLLILGVWLQLYGAVKAQNRLRTMLTLAALPVLPIATLAFGGFLGYGVSWILSAVAFLFVAVRRRIWFYAAAPFAVLFGLSLFVAYMGERAGIREYVWHKEASFIDRLDRISAIATKFELLDIDNQNHIYALNVRLNQNILVGAGVIRHRDGMVDLTYGETVPWWVLIPRAIWPGKPEVGGSGSLVSDFTGISFAAGTSVGIGQVLEFYMNFDVPGVVVGFGALGFLLMWLDCGIMRAIALGDLRGLLLRCLPGLTLLQPGGSLLEILVAFVSAFIAAQILLHFKLVLPLAGQRTSAPNMKQPINPARVITRR